MAKELKNTKGTPPMTDTMRPKKKKIKNHQNWTWIIIVTFFILGFIDTRFGIFGVVCMGTPIVHALRGDGKIHCSKHCPRGSFLGRWLGYISLNRQLPSFMRTKTAKHILLILMVSVFSFSLYHTGFVFAKVAFVLLRFMGLSFLIGIMMGIFFKPRSWCVVCPMGHGAKLIADGKKKKKAPLFKNPITLFNKQQFD